MRTVCIAGVGMSQWGEVWRTSLRQLFADAAGEAIKNAGVDHLDSLYVGCMSGGLFVQQEHLGSLMADYMGMPGLPAMRVESACASGGMALRAAYFEVAAGAAEIVMAGGAEKMTDCTGDQATAALATAADQEYEVFNGATFPGLYAMMAHAHMARYGTTRAMLTAVAVKNHRNGSMNPFAQYPFPVKPETVESSVMVADPLRILDCSPITDGAAAAILCSEEVAKKLGRPYVRIIGSGAATDTIQLAQRADLTTIKAAALATARALQQAGRKITDVQFAEVHDCFTIAELVVLESMGVYKPGGAGPATLAGETALDGKFPVNPSGGLKSKGHPVGATGIAQAVEVFKQLTRQAEGGRQIKGNLRIGMAQNMGGSGGSSVVHIMEVA
ncbi:MAG TPA: thiolase domain-containing protein [candidate division Zixibacteria bacterium]|nr:thiolase domain-containing protein [candidate division Zixibacteria bacterium]MDD4918494.1 thiolase domain-containing protein [candidate division Zixibacteria bacterium]MDM7971821.1 thiolase domain-containing protein [candidate division Zixibacteria bacterium]HOD65931.1 thiolase domain-containing protein [candidate division Zixibacteria bacterium]HOZ07574.1 thiolase domain-containing protein [candidate division Zixibacteria bacterium]